ncbi:3-oxoacyl-ACP synthase III family protein [Amycolatopsis pithecellobii]|uniref:3-oxoacyl-ACP synthase n=1 Tax=Amycolatopsis pithecellobii TaxID=664692 RepID=A0A6N7Z9U7_9PSEU|nr:3-oxoacyl-ACP synthase III family protein [Amycolatopsis pithecellobii]MTD58506.1 3-oxoacyl-ACP synthase [Amycolatopsis pithecellobii]
MAESVVHISSVGTALPGPAVTNAELGAVLGLGPVFEQWVDGFIGTKTRHLAIDLATGEVRYSLADLGETAARQALSAAGIQAGEVDVVIMGTSMPDSLLPTTVNLIADRLGIAQVPTFQIQSGCTGAMQALYLATRLLGTGGHRTALVLGGDVCAKHVDLGIDYAKLPPSEWVNTVLFGDGVGAVLLRAAEPGQRGVRLNRVLTTFTGLGEAPGQRVEWFGLRDRGEDLPAVQEDYKAIEERVPVLALEIVDELLDGLNWKRSDVDYLLPPQLSPKMTGRIVAGLDMPAAAEIGCVERTGNTANALPFFQLEELLPRLTAGDRALAVSVESSKWIKGGFTLEVL